MLAQHRIQRAEVDPVEMIVEFNSNSRTGIGLTGACTRICQGCTPAETAICECRGSQVNGAGASASSRRRAGEEGGDLRSPAGIFELGAYMELFPRRRKAFHAVPAASRGTWVG